MAELTSLNRPLTEAETEEFHALGLKPGHWIALAPWPLFRPDLLTPHPEDLQLLAQVQQPLRVEHQQDPERIAETKLFWKRLCQRTLTAEALEIGHALLAWFLATRIARNDREAYLSVLDSIAAKLSKSVRSPSPSSEPSYSVRQRIERYLPHARYTRYPADPRVPPPFASQVADLLGVDLWKQMLVAPIAGALSELQTRASAAASVAEVLAHVTIPNLYNKPYPLETYLAAGCWRRLFDGLLNPARRDETRPFIESGMEIAARGLASLAFSERENLLQTIHEQIVRGIDQAELRKVTAGTWIARMRMKVEDVIGQAEAISVAVTPAVKPLPSRSLAEASESTRISDHSSSSAPVNVNSPWPYGQTVPMSPSTPPPSPPPAPVAPPAPSEPAVLVQRAQPFTMVSFDEVMAQVSNVPFKEIRAWLENPAQPLLLFDDQRTECIEVAIIRAVKDVPSVLWIIGDLHADVLSLANIIAHAERVNPEGAEPPAFVFLGDFVDRGRHDRETLLLLFQLILKHPNRVCIIPGNHDIDLQWDEKAEKFRVTIEPAEYCERLNNLLRSTDEKDREEVEFAKLLIAFFRKRPKAAILPDGTLLAHGGFPHTDIQAAIKKPDQLGLQYCQNDFLWARIAETARKRPNRGNRGHEFGWETFNQFCKVSAQIGVPVKRFVRGHDHILARWQYYPDYVENPVLTINAMGRRMDGEADTPDRQHPFPVMARYVPNTLPIVVQLPLDPREVNRAFGKENPINAVGLDRAGGLSAADTPNDTRVKEIIPHIPTVDSMDEVALGVQLETQHNVLPKPNADSQQ